MTKLEQSIRSAMHPFLRDLRTSYTCHGSFGVIPEDSRHLDHFILDVSGGLVTGATAYCDHEPMLSRHYRLDSCVDVVGLVSEYILNADLSWPDLIRSVVDVVRHSLSAPDVPKSFRKYLDSPPSDDSRFHAVPDIRHMRSLTGMSQAAFSAWLHIPIRTIEDWEAGRRTPPNYVCELIDYKIRHPE